MHEKSMKKILFFKLMMLLCVGCGQTGELYLPKDGATNSQSESSRATNSLLNALEQSTKKKQATQPPTEPSAVPAEPEAK
jgi:predicted small lipoprotein YifL